MIKRVKYGAYDEYEQLLLKREHYLKEAYQIQTTYSREFGDMINAAFEKMIECVRLKKMLDMCQILINRGQDIDVDVMDETIRSELANIYAELGDMLTNTKAAKLCSPAPAAVALEVKRTYQKLAKLLHPDMHPMTDTVPERKELWNCITVAYYYNDLEELKRLEDYTLAAADRLGIGGGRTEIPDIEKRIAQLEREINELITSAPYLYKEILDDPAEMEQKRANLRAELEEYEDDIQELQEQLNEILMKSGRRITWQMNLY